MLVEEDLNISRYEIKFTDLQSNYFRLKNWILINSNAFYTPYPKRMVNNIYFDNFDCDSYVENLTGSSSRTKLRLRWYGETLNPKKGVLELKSKRNRLGFKCNQPVSFQKGLAEMTYQELIGKISNQLTGDLSIRFQVSQTPILINRYVREYFVTQDQKIRATLDRNLVFYDQRYKLKPNIVFQSLVPEICIFEIKTPSTELERVEKVLATIEHQPSKSSKYVLGVQSLIGYQ